MKQLKIRSWGNQSGSMQWRLIHPMKYLNKLGHQCEVNSAGFTPEDMYYDIFVPQGIVDVNFLVKLIEFQKGYSKKIVMDFDDFMKVNPDSPHYKEHEVADALAMLTSFARRCDMLTTTNPILAKELSFYNENVKIVPNYMDLEVWQYPIERRDDDKVRICWMGSITHLRDMGMVVDVLKRIMDDFPQVELQLMGDMRMKDLFEGYPVEVSMGVPFESYPQKLNGLKMDIGICPLLDNLFNLCKSPIKHWEVTIGGGATICSPTVYDSVVVEGKTGFIANNENEWYEKLSFLIKNKEKRLQMWGNAYDNLINNFSLKEHINEWEKVYQSVL